MSCKVRDEMIYFLRYWGMKRFLLFRILRDEKIFVVKNWMEGIIFNCWNIWGMKKYILFLKIIIDRKFFIA